MKFFTISFFVIPKSEYDFIHYRHGIDNHAFSSIADVFTVKHLKLLEPGLRPEKQHSDEIFFTAKKGFFQIPKALYLFIKKEKPEVLFIHGFIFPWQLFLLRFFIPSSTKILVQHHAEKPFVNSLKRWFQKLSYSKADAYLFSAPGLSDSYVSSGIIKDESKVFEIMEGSSLFKQEEKAKCRSRLGIKEEFVFLWVGRLNANKDPLCVLNAFLQLKKTGKPFKLYMIYGSNELEGEVKSFIKQNDLEFSIQLIGRVQHPDLQTWFSAADYFIAASHYEGSGIALCESMACGCIPIVSKIPSFTSMTDNGRCGYLFDTGNSSNLYQLLIALEHDKIETESSTVRRKFEEDLSFPAIGKKILSVIRIINQK